MPDYTDYTTFSTASGKNLHYVVLQVTLKENSGAQAPETSQTWRT